MSEYDIAINDVYPYLTESYKWPKGLISNYGRVPVQIGTSTVWADFVCYIGQNKRIQPWLLVEVKRKDTLSEETIGQAESYSVLLGTPYFCITDGSEYIFYLTGKTQGKSIPLNGIPPLPNDEFLQMDLKYGDFPQSLDNIIELFIIALDEDKEFLKDTKNHETSIFEINRNIFQNIESLNIEKIKSIFDKYLMLKTPNRNTIYNEIENNFSEFIKTLYIINEFHSDPVRHINKLLERKVKGGGIFFLTQLLAAAHPNEYIVLEENISRALKYLGITDIVIKTDVANGYVYINDICKRIYNEKLKDRVMKYNLGFSAVHNLLWHYYSHYKDNKKWMK